MDKLSVRLTQQADYRFEILFSDELPPIMGDEPPPLGNSSGISPPQLLAAAVANCLSDSLLFSLRKFKQSPEPIQTTASCEVGRNSENHLRVIGILVELKLGVAAARLEYLDRVFKQFRDFCTVSSSVSLGIPVRVTVIDADGVKVFEGS